MGGSTSPRQAPNSAAKRTGGARRVVQATAERLRELVLASEPDTNIGSLPNLAQQFDVGVVTLQQAARILEHEGLLEVRRGPGGGYYGKRPDDAALERSMSAYMRVHGTAYHEVVEVLTMLEVELVVSAARRSTEPQRQALLKLVDRIDGCDTPDLRVAFERDLHNQVFRMVERPLIEMLSRVTMRLQRAQAPRPLFVGEEGVEAWKIGRRRILQALIQQDEELAQFEAVRYRQETLRRLEDARLSAAAEDAASQ
jgi:GntR family transcriptional repressor for pyruvate dehydrogenase complex